MKSFMKTIDLDGLDLADIMPVRGRRPRQGAQVELNFILWLSGMLIVYEQGNLQWWALVIQRSLSQESLGVFPSVPWHPESTRQSWHQRRKHGLSLAEEAAMNYQFEVDPSDKEAMQALEAKVRARRAQIGDEAVDG
jgi:hypothetical protein